MTRLANFPRIKGHLDFYNILGRPFGIKEYMELLLFGKASDVR